MTPKIPKVAILPILTSMISNLRNPLILKILHSGESRKHYPILIMKCDERKKSKKRENIEMAMEKIFKKRRNNDV